MSETKEFCWGTGRRKTSVARVRIREGEGKIVINKRSLEEFFPAVTQREMVLSPLQLTNSLGKYEIVHLRERFLASLGWKRFHHLLLEGGEIPFALAAWRFENLKEHGS